MVQNHQDIHTIKIDENVHNRSKLLVEISSLRENNKILAKSVTEKALRICELEDVGLSFENLKLESHKSITSFHDYLANMEFLAKKAITELSELVNRFCGILSNTKEQKEKVKHLSSLIDKEVLPLKRYNLRNKTKVSETKNKKCAKRNDSKSIAKRVHPMDLKNTVCILETVNENSDILKYSLVEERGDNGKKKQNQSTKKKVENKMKTEPGEQQQKCDTCARISNLVLSPSLGKGSKELIKTEILTSQINVKNEPFSPKDNSDSANLLLEKKVKVDRKKCPLNVINVEQSPRKLRPRKSINYSELSSIRMIEMEEGHHKSCSKSVHSDVDDVKFKNEPQLIRSEKKINQKTIERKFLSPFSQKQEKVDTFETSHRRELDKKYLVKTSKHDSTRKSLKDTFPSIDDVAHEFVKRSDTTSQSENKLLSISKRFADISEKSLEFQSFPYLISRLSANEQFAAIKQEPISPRSESNFEMNNTLDEDVNCEECKENNQNNLLQ